MTDKAFFETVENLIDARSRVDENVTYYASLSFERRSSYTSPWFDTHEDAEDAAIEKFLSEKALGQVITSCRIVRHTKHLDKGHKTTVAHSEVVQTQQGSMMVGNYSDEY